jgi:ABC-type nitrate/sulfonate/bicarbonate transport system substrate-binding protein
MKRSTPLLAVTIVATVSLLAACSSSANNTANSAAPTSAAAGTTEAPPASSAPATSAAASSAPATPTAKPASSVNLVEGGSESFADAAIAKAIDLLKAQGITVNKSVVDDPATALRAVVAGQADIALLDPVEAVTAVMNGDAPVKFLGSLSQSTDYELIALPNVTLDNLAGKKFATAGPGTAGEVIAKAALTKQNIDFSSVDLVKVGGTSARITAILAGQVDIAPVHAADASPAVGTGNVKVLAELGSVLGQYLQQGIIASDTFAADTATAQAVVNAFIDAERFANSDKQGYLDLAKASDLQGDLTDAEAAAAYDGLKGSKIFATNGAICEDAVNVTLTYDKAVPDSELNTGTVPAYDKWVDPQYVNNYLAANPKDADGYC